MADPGADTDPRLLRLRAELHGAPQLLKGEKLEYFKELLLEVVITHFPDMLGAKVIAAPETVLVDIRDNIVHAALSPALTARIAELEQRQVAYSDDTTDLQYEAAVVLDRETGAVLKSRHTPSALNSLTVGGAVAARVELFQYFAPHLDGRPNNLPLVVRLVKEHDEYQVRTYLGRWSTWMPCASDYPREATLLEEVPRG